MSGQKRLIIADDEEVEAEESNPFSFVEFLRSKNQDLEQTHGKEEEEEEDWGRSRQSAVDSTSSLCTAENEEETRFNYVHDETHAAEVHGTCGGGRRRWSGDMQQLKEENMSLRRTVTELQSRSHAHKQRLTELSKELLQRRHQEEEEARDLESMVHSVEQNLHLMTKRALKAENSVSKLKVELQQLQVEAESLRVENTRLKAAESQTLVMMRQNARVASEYLNKTASHAHSSIRQLLEEAQTLRLASQLLQSIDKISSLHTDS
ncbi:endosome-associated-trafficking regulator 1 isoform X4 [Betta splendens]|uniref:Endosome-associated-trafficking regulator 1 n=1 Tax=Betta splendens TaxID=158456 RepID=A0A9W2XZT3_BETSP|nr:endosome-associated-trafficking regulator 1 isoform X4 [Betta splendens]